MSLRCRASGSALLAVVLLGSMLSLTPAAVAEDPASASQTQPVAGDPAGSSTGATGADGETERAQEALEVVEGLLAEPATPADPAPAAERGTDLTVALRDLALNQRDLARPERARASDLLARPTDANGVECTALGTACYGPVAMAAACNTAICVHYPTTVAPGGFGDHRATLGYAQAVLSTVTHVADTFAAAGYRRPLPDGGAGGDDRFDVYLANIGGSGYYGYCTTDQKPKGHVPAASYCVLDNDYSAAEFGTRHTAVENLQVTAAHEYFHAVQFAYDFASDAWLMEASAAWAEDEIYPQINDNLQFLKWGQLRNPGHSLDRWINYAAYGNWVFLRYLSERYPARYGALPVVIRDIWEQLALPGVYSVKGIQRALKGRGTTLAKQLARYAAGNRRPARSYAEGGLYGKAPLADRVKFNHRRRAVAADFRLDHLASATFRFKHARSLKGKLRIKAKLNKKKRAALVVSIKRKGSSRIKVKQVKVSRKGNATKRLKFGKSVKWVEVTVVNASIRYACNRPGHDTTSTCIGVSKDDNMRQRLWVSVR